MKLIALTQQQFLLMGREHATGRRYVAKQWVAETPREPKLSPEQLAAQAYQAALDKLAKWNRSVAS